MIPGILIAIVTFPGVIVHEFAHQLFCRLTRVAVFQVCYFRFGNPSGFVIHETPKRPAQQILIAVGPFLVNSVVGPLVAMPGVLPVLKFQSGSPLDYILVWLGVSIAMHAFPSTGDAKTMWKGVKAPGTGIGVKLIAYPVAALIYAGALGSFFWLDAIYGLAICGLLPALIVAALT